MASIASKIVNQDGLLVITGIRQMTQSILTTCLQQQRGFQLTSETAEEISRLLASKRCRSTFKQSTKINFSACILIPSHRYNIPNAYLDDSVNALGIFEDNQAYAQEDLDLYFSNYAPYVPNGTHPTNNIIDGARPVPPVPVTNKYDEGEPDIDFDMAYSLIYPQKITLYQAQSIQYPNGTNVDNGVFQTLLDAIDGSYCNYTAFGITGDSPGIDPTYPNPQYYNGQ